MRLVTLRPYTGHLIDHDGRSFLVSVLDRRDGEIDIKIPGHKIASGYDRMAGGNTYSYRPVERTTLIVTETYTDRGAFYAVGHLKESA